MVRSGLARRLALVLLVAGSLTALLPGCSSTPSRPQPGPLPAVSGAVKLDKAWTARLGELNTPLQMAVQGTRVVVATTTGVVAQLDADTGQELWRLQLKDVLHAGVGSDGRRHAVITAGNELVVIDTGREIWRQRLTAHSYTSPLVAGERVFVLTADRSLMAFDGATGQRLWAVQRSASDALVLRQAGLLAAVGDTLLAGNGGRLSGLQPLNGQVRWEVLIGSTRGTNEVERLVDLVAGHHRQGQTVCVRSFQTSVACIDAARGQLLWSRASQGHQGLDGDEGRLFGVESDSKLRAWSRRDGQVAWAEDAYRFRGLSAPRVWGPMLALGDGQGLLHLLSRDDGKTLQRQSTDGSPLAAQPVVAGRTLVTLNRSGLVTGWRAD